jgi:hypothetical protein
MYVRLKAVRVYVRIASMWNLFTLSNMPHHKLTLFTRTPKLYNIGKKQIKKSKKDTKCQRQRKSTVYSKYQKCTISRSHSDLRFFLCVRMRLMLLPLKYHIVIEQIRLSLQALK